MHWALVARDNSGLQERRKRTWRKKNATILLVEARDLFETFSKTVYTPPIRYESWI